MNTPLKNTSPTTRTKYLDLVSDKSGHKRVHTSQISDQKTIPRKPIFSQHLTQSMIKQFSPTVQKYHLQQEEKQPQIKDSKQFNFKMSNSPNHSFILGDIDLPIQEESRQRKYLSKLQTIAEIKAVLKSLQSQFQGFQIVKSENQRLKLQNQRLKKQNSWINNQATILKGEIEFINKNNRGKQIMNYQNQLRVENIKQSRNIKQTLSELIKRNPSKKQAILQVIELLDYE